MVKRLIVIQDSVRGSYPCVTGRSDAVAAGEPTPRSSKADFPTYEVVTTSLPPHRRWYGIGMLADLSLPLTPSPSKLPLDFGDRRVEALDFVNRVVEVETRTTGR